MYRSGEVCRHALHENWSHHLHSDLRALDVRPWHCKLKCLYTSVPSGTAQRYINISINQVMVSPTRRFQFWYTLRRHQHYLSQSALPSCPQGHGGGGTGQTPVGKIQCIRSRSFGQWTLIWVVPLCFVSLPGTFRLMDLFGTRETKAP